MIDTSTKLGFQRKGNILIIVTTIINIKSEIEVVGSWGANKGRTEDGKGGLVVGCVLLLFYFRWEAATGNFDHAIKTKQIW